MTTPPPEPVRLTAHSVQDLLAVVPYRLGFHPAESLVIVFQHETEIICIARGDLPAADTPQSELDSIGAYFASCAPPDTTAVVLIGYGPAGQDTRLVDAVRGSLSRVGLRVLDGIRVSDGRYFSYVCTDPDCCPLDGTPLDAGNSRLAAEATYAGLLALPDRAALAARLAPVEGPERQAMHHATARARHRTVRLAVDTERELGDSTPTSRTPDAPAGATVIGKLLTHLTQAGKDAVRDALAIMPHGGRLSDDQAGWLTVLLRHQPVQDYAALDTVNSDTAIDLWMDLTRRAEPDLVPAPASLLAFAAWRRGNGVLARIALDRALTADPAFDTALLLTGLLDRAVPPSAFDPTFLLDDPDPGAADEGGNAPSGGTNTPARGGQTP